MNQTGRSFQHDSRSRNQHDSDFEMDQVSEIGDIQILETNVMEIIKDLVTRVKF